MSAAPGTHLHVASVALLDAMTHHLRTAGLPATGEALAAVLGTTPAQLSSSRTGRAGSFGQLHRWLESWAAAGHPQIELWTTGTAVGVRWRSAEPTLPLADIAALSRFR